MKGLDERITTWVDKKPFWGVARVDRQEGVLKVNGWLVSTQERIESSCLVCSGLVAENIELTESSGAQLDRFAYMPDGVVCYDFRCSASSMGEDDVEIHLCDAKSLKPYNEYASYFWGEWLEDYALPPRTLIELVAGGYYPYLFNLNGYSTYMNANKILKQVAGAPLAEFDNLLDWGCGCGRTTRFFQRERKCPNVYGVDIISELVEFCQSEYTFGEFAKVKTVPPIPYADSTFDLVFAFSVLTHIKEKEHLDWLEELDRVTKPGAVLLLSVHNFNSLAYVGFSQKPLLMENFDRYGFADAGECDNLDGFIVEEDYYHNVFHSLEYIEKIWSKYFNIVDVIIGANARHQDIVVLRKR